MVIIVRKAKWRRHPPKRTHNRDRSPRHTPTEYSPGQQRHSQLAALGTSAGFFTMVIVVRKVKRQRHLPNVHITIVVRDTYPRRIRPDSSAIRTWQRQSPALDFPRWSLWYEGQTAAPSAKRTHNYDRTHPRRIRPDSSAIRSWQRANQQRQVFHDDHRCTKAKRQRHLPNVHKTMIVVSDTHGVFALTAASSAAGNANQQRWIFHDGHKCTKYQTAVMSINNP